MIFPQEYMIFKTFTLFHRSNYSTFYLERFARSCHKTCTVVEIGVDVWNDIVEVVVAD
jgi:hypothetical protein